MRNYLIPVTLIASILTACSSSGSVSSENGQVAGENGNEEVICRRVVQTGTHFARRVCMSREEFAELDRQTQDVLSEANRSNSSPQSTN